MTTGDAMIEISCEELYALDKNSYLLIDIRNYVSVGYGSVKGALHIDENKILEKSEILPKDKELKKKNPEVEAHIFRSVENVNLDTVIGYKAKGIRHHFLDKYDNV